MKRCLLTLYCLVLGLALKAQSPYTCQYWFDQDHGQAVTTTFEGDLCQMEIDAGSLSAGLHTLCIIVQDTTETWCAPRSYLFYQTTAWTAANVMCHFWFDQDFGNRQSMPFGTGQFLLDADNLEMGLHLLNVTLENEGLTTTEQYLFYRDPSNIDPTNPTEVVCHYWFDQDFENMQSMPFGTGQFLLDTGGLSEGLHLLNVTLEYEGLTTTEQYLFYRDPSQLDPTNTAEVICHFWFDEDFEHKQSCPFGTGGFLLDTRLLGEGQHTVYILLESESLTTSTQSYTFEKHLVEGHVIVTIANPTGAGTLSGQGWYEQGDTCMLIATANQGYVFDNWSNEGNIVSDSTTYSFTVTEDATFVANFVEIIVLDTTIYAEICHGEDYVENGFEIIQPEVGIGNYSMVLHPAFNYDSIVNLALTVHPTYYIIEDTTLCNMTPFQWHGNTYTESGLYFDTLQTIHGCDSIYALSLEFFNTPLGEFTYMSPANNYPFTSLPITVSWDAVSGAEYYDLYLWDVNDPAPSTPYAGNIYNRSCYVSSLQNHQTYNWYVEAVNTCFSTTSSVRSFTLNIPPSMSVSQGSLNFGEVALNNSNTLNLYVSGNALDETITMQMMGEDASMFSFEQGINWNGLTGGLLSVTFRPTAVQYNYTANLVITNGTLTQTVQLTGSLADMFVFNTYVTQDVFEMNSTIPIYGTVMDANNNPASSAEVEVKVTVMNMTRSLFATTGTDGHFSVDFVPAYSESGYYTINSGRVGHNSTAVHDDFNIPGMNLVTNDWILWDVVQNETSTGSIVIRNRSQIPLNNIQVTANTLPEGCSFTFQPLSLQGMEEGVLEYSVSGTTPTNGYQEVALVATSSEGASMNFTVWYRCAEPRGILYASPNNITTTMTKGINKIVDVMLYNNGTGPTGSVYLDLPSVDWLSVVGNDTLPSIAVHDSAYFSLRLSANENTPLVQYTGNLAVNCERGDGLLLPYTIMAVSDSTGTLVVDVTDDYTYNGNGQHLAGATVTVKGYYSLETVAVGLTDSNGLFTVSDIPEGYYRMSITAPHHAEYQATIQIECGQTNTQNIYLQYQAITYSWNVVPTEIQDEYTFELIVEYETNVPVPVVVIDMPQTFPELAEGESFVFDYIITNYGLVDTYDATLYPPTNHPLYDFTPLITEIDTLHAQSSVVIPCTMTVRTEQRSPLVYAALNGRGERDDDCPDMAKTEVWSYYYCNGEKVYVKGYKYVQIGSHPCETPPSSGGGGGGGGGGVPGGGGSGGGGGHLSGSGGSCTPPVTTQQQGCSEDPNLPGALEGAMGGLGGCPPPSDGTPKLPPQPGNNGRNNN